MLQTYGFIVGKRPIYLIHPHEDAFKISEDQNLLAVADGITRDPCRTLRKGLLGKIYMELLYPRPSPAQIAAEVATDIFIGGPFYTIKDRIRNANEAVKDKANNKLGISEGNTDYLMNDLGGCTFAGVIRKKNTIELGVLSPCGVAIVSDMGNIIYKTEDTFWKNDKARWEHKPLSNHTDKEGRPLWHLPGTRHATRRYCRNEPKQPFAFGVLTGEEQALEFLQMERRELTPTDRLLVYTDGMAEVLFERNGELNEEILRPEIVPCVRDNDVQKLEDIAKKRIRTEGALIYQASWISPSP